jgi:hypothetical protein
MKQRIRHLFPHHGRTGNLTGMIVSEAQNAEEELIPRGWINPQGHFLKTKQHWSSINSHFRRPDSRSKAKEEAPEEAEAAEKNAHLAYSLGWISVGHAGKLNAIGHLKTFEADHHPAVETLRQLLEHLPFFTIQVEVQKGNFLPARGVHEDFEVREFDLDILIKRGRLRQKR